MNEEIEPILPPGIPREGFIKVTRPEAPLISSQQRVQLVRKGNELFSMGEYEQAKKIFVATAYSDGMIRLGDVYMKQGDPLSALQMYKMAPAPDKVRPIVEKMAKVIKKWLKEPIHGS